MPEKTTLQVVSFVTDLTLFLVGQYAAPVLEQ